MLHNVRFRHRLLLIKQDIDRHGWLLYLIALPISSSCLSTKPTSSRNDFSFSWLSIREHKRFVAILQDHPCQKRQRLSKEAAIQDKFIGGCTVWLYKLLRQITLPGKPPKFFLEVSKRYLTVYSKLSLHWVSPFYLQVLF